MQNKYIPTVKNFLTLSIDFNLSVKNYNKSMGSTSSNPSDSHVGWATPFKIGIDIETFSKAVDRAREGEAYGVYGSEKFVMELCEMRHPGEIEQRGFHKYAIWLNKN